MDQIEDTIVPARNKLSLCRGRQYEKISNRLLVLRLMSACAQSSGVMKLGPDTYTVSVHAAPARGGESGAKHIEEVGESAAGICYEVS